MELKDKAKLVASCAVSATLWHIGKERNNRSFEDKHHHFDSFCTLVWVNFLTFNIFFFFW